MVLPPLEHGLLRMLGFICHFLHFLRKFTWVSKYIFGRIPGWFVEPLAVQYITVPYVPPSSLRPG